MALEHSSVCSKLSQMPAACTTGATSASRETVLHRLLPLPTDPALLSSSGPAMVVLLGALCELGESTLTSEAINSCYMEIGAIPYEVLWAALQAHHVSGNTSEARSLFKAWLDMHKDEPADATQFDKRVLRIFHLLSAQATRQSNCRSHEELVELVERSLRLPASRAKLRTAMSPIDVHEATAACSCYDDSSMRSAPMDPTPSLSLPLAKVVPTRSCSGSASTSCADTTSCSANSGYANGEVCGTPTVDLLSGTSQPVELHSGLQVLFEHLRHFLAYAYPHGSWRWCDAEQVARRTLLRLQRTHNKLVFAIAWIAVLLLVRKTRTRNLARPRLNALLAHLQPLFKMLLGGGTPVTLH